MDSVSLHFFRTKGERLVFHCFPSLLFSAAARTMNNNEVRNRAQEQRVSLQLSHTVYVLEEQMKLELLSSFLFSSEETHRLEEVGPVHFDGQFVVKPLVMNLPHLVVEKVLFVLERFRAACNRTTQGSAETHENPRERHAAFTLHASVLLPSASLWTLGQAAPWLATQCSRT